ncbi:uncharacterized protein LOC118204873 isoform X2 [Stegodyphus dumicola]|uniref:uncharacterized protein LOC118204873 isoform X2 n=1 Tax=Stegodyphus dumicola TaxID=202533 RepID=UPI0015B10874|nr:uncharacterized protein LOC118204873 isoform X2 [Stegodyphus dumicola]
MMFVNEEFEESQPVFSEPKKVHPETDDEMARRIKSMLGEYVHKGDFPASDRSGPVKKEVNSTLPHVKSFPKCSEMEASDPDSTLCREAMEELYKNNQCDKNSNDKAIASTANEISHISDKNSVSEQISESSSRRSSLKRQCKEKISLLDYNPMFMIRTKRTKSSSSSKSKSIGNAEESKTDNSEKCNLPSLANPIPVSNTLRAYEGNSVDKL